MKKHKHGGDIYSRYIADGLFCQHQPFGDSEGGLKRLSWLLWTGWYIIRMWNAALSRAMLSEKEGIPADLILCGNGAAELIFALANGL